MNKIVLNCIGLYDHTSQQTIANFLTQFSAELKGEYDHGVTHVILSNGYQRSPDCFRNACYYSAIINKKHVLSSKWIVDSLKNGKVEAEAPYAWQDTCNKMNVAEKSRNANDLFKDFAFLCGPVITYNYSNLFPGTTEQVFKGAIANNGGMVVNSLNELATAEKKFKIILVDFYHPDYRAFLSSQEEMRIEKDSRCLRVFFCWILCCLTKYTLNPLYNFLDDNMRENSENAQKYVPAHLVEFDSEENKMTDVLSKMKLIFPRIDPNFVKKIHALHVRSNYCLFHEDFYLNTLINYLLQYGENYMTAEPANQDDQVEVQEDDGVWEERYENLLEIFPNADPTFLRDFIDSHPKHEELFNFIEKHASDGGYPTKAEYLEKLKISEQQKQYTENFQVERFLEIFPNPVGFFEDPNRKGENNMEALQFLKSHFNRNKVVTINRLYKQNNFNVSLTARALLAKGKDMVTVRKLAVVPSQSIPLLQEIAYVAHKEEIVEKLEQQRIEEEKLFATLEAENKLLSCDCCFNEKCLPHKCISCKNGHIFCFECMRAGVDTALADGLSDIKCFSCNEDLSLQDLQLCLRPKAFSTLLKNNQTSQVRAAGIEGLEFCPFCNFASIPPPRDKIFKCLNEDCMKETCRNCKAPNHLPNKCYEEASEKARLLLEEKMTEALIRTCYKCSKKFVKEVGCNKMICFCGAMMCYLCDKPIAGYDHFNAQGGNRPDLCPLWSDDARLEAEAVRAVAQQVRDVVIKDDPNVQLDLEKLLPVLPKKKATGAHNDITNAYELPVHAAQIVQNLVGK